MMNENRFRRNKIHPRKPKPAFSVSNHKKKHKPRKKHGYVGELEQKLEQAIVENFKGEEVTVVYINGKASVKYKNSKDAAAAVEIMKKKDPNKKYELKKEVRENRDVIDSEKISGRIMPAAEDVDYEGEFSRSKLIGMARRCIKLAHAMDDVSQLDSWVQDKLSVAANNVQTVFDFLMNSDQEVDEPGARKNVDIRPEAFDIGMGQASHGKDGVHEGKAQQAAIAIAKKKSGKYTKDGRRKKTNENQSREQIADFLFEHERTYEDQLSNALKQKLKK
jgi:hypothetical protein